MGRLVAVSMVALVAFTAILASATALRVDAGVLQVFAYKAEIEIPDLQADVDIKPETLEKASQGEPVLAFIDLPGIYDERKIDLNSVRLCRGTSRCATGVPLGSLPPPGVVGGRLKVGFDRGAVIGLISGVHPPAWVTFTVSGQLLSGIGFYGSDSVRVVDPEGRAAPTSTPAPEPTEMPDPTPTPWPTDTPDITPMPQVTVTPQPTATEQVTATVSPTPMPTVSPFATPVPTPTPRRRH